MTLRPVAKVVWVGRPAGANFTLSALHVHSRVEQVGRVQFEDPTLNRIQDAIVRTQLNNLHSVPTDCPTREKRGWLGDAQVTAAEANLNFDMRSSPGPLGAFKRRQCSPQ